MRIFVTGGTGFIGKPLCAALQGHELLILSRNAARLQGRRRTETLGPDMDLQALPFPLASLGYLQGDIFATSAWSKKVRAFRPEICVHLAWSDLPDYSLPTSAKNFRAGLDLLQFLLEIGCQRIVATGTCYEYGHLTGCVSENQESRSLGLFAAFKAAQRLVMESMCSSLGAALLWARPFFVYGPGQRTTSLIPSTFRSLAAGMRPAIRTPDMIQDFIHVQDVARGLAALATSDAPAGAYNLGSGQPTRVADLVNMIARLFNQSDIYPPATAFQGADAPGAPAPATKQGEGGFWANLDKMRKYTDWKPMLSLEQGLAETLAAWRKPS